MLKRKAIISLLCAALAASRSRERKPARCIHDAALPGMSREDLAREYDVYRLLNGMLI